jgi:hypothetical protein
VTFRTLRSWTDCCQDILDDWGAIRVLGLNLGLLAGLAFLVACAVALSASGLPGLGRNRKPQSNEIVDRVRAQKQTTGMLVTRRRERDETAAISARRERDGD